MVAGIVAGLSMQGFSQYSGAAIDRHLEKV